MVTEDAFQATLEEDPTNSGTRLVFADWLEEQGDARAAGYRWMGTHEKWPYAWARSRRVPRYFSFDWYREGGSAIWDVPAHCRIPEWLWRALQSTTDFAGYPTRRTAEEALCMALVGRSESYSILVGNQGNGLQAIYRRKG
jgi:uncharacterized protein (TIGR02996 family)